MRYLNKIIFINSASVKYAEIGLDGNVHLIGTQGVGKSTLLRAILFFYNANKSKLGISREKKRYDDYYLEYENSYIIYEVVKDNIPFCVLSYKVNGKVAFRFFNSEYRRNLFIDESGKALNWEGIRKTFGKEIYYTKIISNYDEYRRIIYGDNKSLKAEFRKYALVESKQYQNIPRTIQNVLLNANLEAKFIKDTIINSISEDEFKIDIDNYSKNHLRGFETQINDIKIWFKKNKKGQIVVRNQADRVIENYRIINFLKREKRELAVELAGRINYIEKEKGNLSLEFSNEQNLLNDLYKKKEKLKELHLKREQNIVSEIKYITKKLTEAKDKQTEYEVKNIKSILKEVDKKDDLINEKEDKLAEKQLLNSQFSEINQKFEALISQNKNQQKEFENEKNSEIGSAKSEFVEKKLELFEAYQSLIDKVKLTNKEEKEKVENEILLIENKENSAKRKKAELKHKVFLHDEIDTCKNKDIELNIKIEKSKNTVEKSKSEIANIRREWELEQKEIERTSESKIDRETERINKYQSDIKKIKENLERSESSFYGWLNNNVSNWENNIGKLVDEKEVLFSTELNPKKISDNAKSFYGVEINLHAIEKRVKTVDEFQLEIEELENEISEIRKLISSFYDDKEKRLQNLKVKFRKKINILKDVISEKEYTISQSTQELKNNKVVLDELREKAKFERARVLQEIENKLEELSSVKEKSKKDLDKIRNNIKREITKKEKERDTEIYNAEHLKDEKIKSIEEVISKHKDESFKRLAEVKKRQQAELKNKGADISRLNEIESRLNELNSSLIFINKNERIVYEYEKDKRELFDKVPQLKVEKSAWEKKKDSIAENHKIEAEKLNSKYNLQNEKVKSISLKIAEFEKDKSKFEEFKKSEVFETIQSFLNNEVLENIVEKTAISIIEDLKDKHYASVEKYKVLQQAINLFVGNFNEDNVFKFKVKLNLDSDYLDFARDLKEFIELDKISEIETRVNERFSHIIYKIGVDTSDLQSKEAEIEKVIRKINNDFTSRNFVEAIKGMEMRMQKSSNPIVRLLIQIKEFNDEHSLTLGESNLFTTSDSDNQNGKAVELLKQLVKELEKYKNPYLTLSESFDLQFKIIENDNDSGWVEKLSNVGSEGTDVLVKAMINILLLNVFKNNASKKFKDFKLHCMMDEIGRLHPNNVKGILRFANERNILLINGSPTSQNAIDYKHTYKLSKEQSKSDSKKYITRITKLVSVKSKIRN
jgi:hypothetical protein